MLLVMSKASNKLHYEATSMCHYLLGQPPTPLAIQLYTNNFPKASDDRLIQFALRHSWSWRTLDAYCALKHPYGELRQRLFVLIAILEVQPEFADYFLSQKRSPFYFFRLFWHGLCAILAVPVGFFVTKVWLR